MKKKFQYLQKYAAALLILAVISTTFYLPPQKTEAVGAGLAGCVGLLLAGMGIDTIGSTITSEVAGIDPSKVPVIDSKNLAKTTIIAGKTTSLENKESKLDPCLKGIVQEIAHQLTTSIINWINNGFEGGPTFVTNPDQFFGDMADQTLGLFIEGSGLDFLCTPFKLDIQLGLRTSYSRSDYRVYCTPSRIAQVQQLTSDDFGDIGWDGWLDLTSHDENNVYGAWVRSNNDLNNAISYRINSSLQELNWGNGFLSIKDPETGEIQTPGQLIVGQADQVLGSNLRELELAKEFDDIIYALINQLTNQLLTKGLRN